MVWPAKTSNPLGTIWPLVKVYVAKNRVQEAVKKSWDSQPRLQSSLTLNEVSAKPLVAVPIFRRTYFLSGAASMRPQDGGQKHMVAEYRVIVFG